MRIFDIHAFIHYSFLLPVRVNSDGLVYGACSQGHGCTTVNSICERGVCVCPPNYFYKANTCREYAA